MKVALCQTHIIWENKEANYAKAEGLINEAVYKGADLVFFPEMSFTGFSMNIDVTKEKDDKTVNKMIAFAKEYRVALGFGWVKDCGGKVENHYTVIDELGNILSDYTKMHSFLYGGEGEKFNSGGDICQFEYAGMTFTPFICYDLRFPEVFRIAAETTDVFVIPANWPANRAEHWNTLLQARAIENQNYVLGINCVGDVGGLRYVGNSTIIEPDGKITECVSDVEKIIYGIIDKRKMSIREEFNVMQDRKTELYFQLYKNAKA